MKRINNLGLCIIIGLLILTLGLEGSAQNNMNVDASEKITVLSYNIHHANPPSRPGVIDVDAICRVIAASRADIVALQEVDVRTGRSGQIDQAKLIAERSGMDFCFFKSIDHDGGEYGLAILSKYPINDHRTYRLPQVHKAEERILATVKIDVKGQKVVFANTHLDATKNEENRVNQIKFINQTFSDESLPIIICGDFNAAPGSATIDLLDQHFKRTCRNDCLPTIPQINPRKTIDFVATRNLSWKQSDIEVIAETYASDHRPVKVIFEMN